MDTIVPERAIETPPRPRAKSAPADDLDGLPAALWGSTACRAARSDDKRRPLPRARLLRLFCGLADTGVSSPKNGPKTQLFREGFGKSLTIENRAEKRS
jgi:hypothetical protein